MTEEDLLLVSPGMAGIPLLTARGPGTLALHDGHASTLASQAQGHYA